MKQRDGEGTGRRGLVHPRSDMGRESAGLTVQKSEITGVSLKVGTSDTRIVCEPFFFLLSRVMD